ncbi:cell division ATP-binding protein FtsE [Oceanicella actignis]|uniref:cell division ATP-binding protein FtsE n=1 Tax=Oceanicella actignis TaxID=1189325 RepID=UPI0011E6EEEC|nr:ATP-binding cassette domain-containing protein [Oceanicella actignis]TYO91352.1 cell division transport system ATP-binding protein [Oceanicella actignis]
MIEFDGVEFRYGGGREILREVSLTIEAGGFHFLTGPSGAGKSTFLRLCRMALRPSAGRLRVFGVEAAEADADAVAALRRRIGMVFQDGRFLDHLSVFDNVALPLRIRGAPARERRAQAAELIEWVGLGARAHALPAELSGGELQRAALARAVIGAPDLIIADEPTGNVDRETAVELLSLLLALHRHGKGVLIATHDHELIRAARRETPVQVLRIEDGRVLAQGRRR